MCQAQELTDECLQRIAATYPVTVVAPDGSIVRETMHFADCAYDVIRRIVLRIHPERSWTTFELYNSLGRQVFRRDHIKFNTDDKLLLVDVPRIGATQCPSLADDDGADSADGAHGDSNGVRLTLLGEGLRLRFRLNKRHTVQYNQRLLSALFVDVPCHQVWVFGGRVLAPQDTLAAMHDGDAVHILSAQ
jgi:hypothetical protein